MNLPDTDSVFFRDQEYETRLVRSLTQTPRAWKHLEEADRAYVRSVELMAKCRICSQEYQLYDTRQGRVRSFCSKACAERARIRKKWECVLCGRRFYGAWGLHVHIKTNHPDCDKHAYLRAYYQAKGKDLGTLTRYCGICRHERKLNFRYARYEECACIRAERKLEKLERALAQTTEPAEKLKLKHRIGGTRSLLTRYRGKAKTPVKVSDQQSPKSPSEGGG